MIQKHGIDRIGDSVYNSRMATKILHRKHRKPKEPAVYKRIKKWETLSSLPDKEFEREITKGLSELGSFFKKH